jgi:hypothetical protein
MTYALLQMRIIDLVVHIDTKSVSNDTLYSPER